MKNIILFLLALVCIFISFSVSFADDKNNLRVLYDFDKKNIYTKLILTSKEPLTTTQNVKYIFVSDDKNKILIIPGNYDFEKEQQSFAQFRKRYLLFWTIFITMAVTGVW